MKNKYNSYFCTKINYEVLMAEISILVNGIEYKVRKLIEKYHRIKNENDERERLILDLKNEVEILKVKNKYLENKIKIIRIAKGFESHDGKLEAKKKINELLREIDRSIGFLNE